MLCVAGEDQKKYVVHSSASPVPPLTPQRAPHIPLASILLTTHHTRRTSPRRRSQAASLSVRDRLIESWNDTQQYFREQDPKRVYYLSMEFLMGRSLTNSLYNLVGGGRERDDLLTAVFCKRRARFRRRLNLQSDPFGLKKKK